jgi:DNA-binding SARP family transcriptional activator
MSLLGAPEIRVDGRKLDVDTRKASALLVHVAVTGRPVSRETLAALFWPESDPERARATLRRTLSSLRSALGGRWLVTDGETVSLEDDGIWMDVAEFRRLLDACLGHGHPPAETCPLCLEPLEAAVALDRGPFLAGFGLRDSVAFDDWQQALGAELRRDLATALERLADLLDRGGERARAITQAERRLAIDPLNESAHGQLIRLYARAGDRSAALEQYRECVRVLDRELGVRPLDATTDLYHAVLEGTLASPEPAPPPAVAPPAREREYPLTGRDRELATLLAAYRSVGPDGRLVVLLGEAGIGKTRLGEELLAAAAEEGGVALGVRCFREEAELAYGVAVEIVRAAAAHLGPVGNEPWWLFEVARLVPELAPAPRSAIDSVAAQARFYEAVGELLLHAAGTSPPGVLFVDDMHWADESSLGLLGYLIHRLRGRPILIVASWRPEEAPRSHAVRRLLSDAQRNRVAEAIEPGRLTSPDVHALVRATGRDGELAERLFAESGGLPLFVVEYLDALERGEGDAGEWPLPLGVRDLLESRLAGLSELAAQIVAAAAVLGRPFETETVRDTGGRTDDESVRAVEELLAAGLLLEGADGTYDFRHEQTRQLVDVSMTLARRRLLHRRAARALDTKGRRDALAGVIAHHLEQAGDDAAAADLYRAAGDRARSLFAHAEALAHYRAAIALGHPDRPALLVACGDLETLAGDYGAALATYETAAALAPTELRPEIEHRRGLLHLRRGKWELADAEFEAALQHAPPASAPRILADRSLAAHRLGATERALRLARLALNEAEDAGDPRTLAQAHNIVGILATSRGEADEAVTHLLQSRELASGAQDDEAEVAALNNLALAVSATGDEARALELATSALELCSKLGDRHREAAIRNTLADLLHRVGREEEAMDELKRAVAIFAEIGESGQLEPEIWKLSEW